MREVNQLRIHSPESFGRELEMTAAQNIFNS
jgi:hypothetical protein